MASSAGPSQSKQSKEKLTMQDIVSGYTVLHVEERKLAEKISEMELEVHEHKMVIERLKQADENRRCFRKIGGVLVEKTVKNVLPDVEMNGSKLESAVEALKKQLKMKGEEKNEYRKKYNLQFHGKEDFESEDLESENPRNEEKVSRPSSVLVNPM